MALVCLLLMGHLLLGRKRKYSAVLNSSLLSESSPRPRGWATAAIAKCETSTSVTWLQGQTKQKLCLVSEQRMRRFISILDDSPRRWGGGPFGFFAIPSTRRFLLRIPGMHMPATTIRQRAGAKEVQPVLTYLDCLGRCRLRKSQDDSPNTHTRTRSLDGRRVPRFSVPLPARRLAHPHFGFCFLFANKRTDHLGYDC